jgi:hypothetical protein
MASTTTTVASGEADTTLTLAATGMSAICSGMAGMIALLSNIRPRQARAACGSQKNKMVVMTTAIGRAGCFMGSQEDWLVPDAGAVAPDQATMLALNVVASMAARRPCHVRRKGSMATRPYHAQDVERLYAR